MIIIQNGQLVSPSGLTRADLALDGGRIVAIEPHIEPGEGDTVHDAAGCYVFPGFIDGHTHLDMESGSLVTADDFTTGTRAAVCGGTTTIVDFATQDKGGTLNDALDAWHKKADGKCSCNYAFHMAITDWNDQVKAELPEMFRRGVTSFKAYMAYDALKVNDAELLEILQSLKPFGGILGVHCENGLLVNELQARQKELGHFGPDAHPASRPAEVEAEAVNRLCYLSKLADTPVHVVHLSTELEPLTDPIKAMQPDAPKLHDKGNILTKEVLKRGNAEEVIASAPYVVTQHYSTPMTDHAFMEPECAIGIPDGEGGLLMYTASQSVYDEQKEISRMLQIPPEKVRCQTKLVGGGFGGKEDMSVQHHAALMAWATGRPVKVKFSRQESLNIHTKRHAMEMDVTTACDENGKLLAMKATLISDCGAYASLGGPVLQRACTHCGGPYNFQNVDITGICVYTNNVPGGAFRGFGVTQSCFAAELNLDLLAEKVGISPWEIRYRNAIRPGQVLPNGQIAGPETGYAECLEAVKEAYESSPYAGIAGCMKNSGVGVGLPDIGRCSLAVVDGKVHIRTSAACMGQGVATVCTQIVNEVTGVDPQHIFHERADTAITPNSGTSTASRQTVFCGEATRRAAGELAAALNGHTLEDLEGQSFYGEYSGVTDRMGSDKPNPVSHVAYGHAAQVVIMDENKKVVKVVAAHDVGRVVNYQSCADQI